MRHIVQLFISLSLLCQFTTGCDNDPEPNVFDEQYGFNGLILGDSLYPEVLSAAKEAAGSYGTFEKDLLGHTVSNWVEVDDIEARFVFGVAMDRIQARAIDGAIGFYLLANTAAATQVQAKLSDSLHFTLGEPSVVVDSSSSVVEPFVSKAWESQRVALELTIRPADNEAWIVVSDISAKKIVAEIDSSLQAAASSEKESLSALRSIGSVPLDTRIETLRPTKIRDAKMVPVSFDLLESFFEVPAKATSRLGRDPHASAYADGEASDSLSRLVVWLPNNHLPFGDCVARIGQKVGQYDILVRNFKSDGIDRLAAWISRDRSIQVEEDDNDVIVTFYADGGIPGGVFSFY